MIRSRINKRNFMTLFFAACLALSSFFRWIPYPWTTKTGALILVGLFGGFAIALRLFLPFLIHRIDACPVTIRRLTVLLSLTCGAVLLLIGGISVPDRYIFLPSGSIDVSTISGARAEITLFDTGTTDSIESFRTSDGLHWRGNVFHEILLQVKTGSRFGTVQIIRDGNLDDVMRINLNAESDGLETFRFAYPLPILNRLIIQFSTWISLSFLFFILNIYFVSRPIKTIEPKPLSRFWFLNALPMVLVWSIILLTLYPAIMTPDSFDQWNQALTGNINDWHPAIYALIMRACVLAGLPPAALALAQLVVLALVIASGIDLLRRFGVPVPVRAVLLLIFTFSPINLFFPITLWKDIPFGISLFALFLLITETVWTRGKALRNAGFIAKLIMASVGAALFRHNGLPIALASLLLLALFTPHFRKRVLTALTAAGLIVIMVRGSLYTALHVSGSELGGVNQIYLQIIAAHLSAKTPLSSDETAAIEAIAPIETWVYDPCVIGTNRLAIGAGWDYAIRNTAQNFRTVLSLTKKAPLVTLRHFSSSSKMIWRIQPGGCYLYRIGFSKNQGDTYTWLSSETDAIQQRSKLPSLIEPLFELFRISVASERIDSFVWRPALLSWLTLWIYMLIALRMNDARHLLPMAPTLLLCGLMFFITVGQDVRFQYGVILIGLFSLAAPWTKKDSA